MIDAEYVEAHRERAMAPDRPVLRGSAQNPDVFFQTREAANPYYNNVPAIVQRLMNRFAERTGRAYRLFDYVGAPDAERVVVLMGSGWGAAQEAVERVKDSIRTTYGKRGETVVKRNLAAVDQALEGLIEVEIPDQVSSTFALRPPVPDSSPDFVQRVTIMMIAGKGDLLPVSALPVDGTFPTGTACYEKRSIAHEIPIWDPSICIECAGKISGTNDAHTFAVLINHRRAAYAAIRQ